MVRLAAGFFRDGGDLGERQVVFGGRVVSEAIPRGGTVHTNFSGRYRALQRLERFQ